MSAIYLNSEDTRLLELAARYCSLLQQVEQAFMLDDEAALDSLLSQIDPVDCTIVASELRALVALAEALERGGTTLSSAHSKGAVPSAPRESAEPALEPSAPVTSLDGWSRKVPCR